MFVTFFIAIFLGQRKMASGGYGEDFNGQKQPMSAVDFAEMMDVEYSVDEYFEPEELAKMSPIEKRRYKNLRANYEVMKKMG